MKQTDKRIAFYISSLNTGGAERVVSTLANRLAMQGYAVTVITDGGEKKAGFALDNRINRIILPVQEGRGRVCNAVKRVRNLRKAAKVSRSEVLVAFAGKSNLRGVLATRCSRIGCVVCIRTAPAREYPTRFRRILARILFTMAEGAVFQTDEAQQYFSERVRRKSVVLMNPLNPDFVQPRYEGVRKQEIVTVGRLHKVKNHEMLIDTFSEIAADYPQVALRIFGDGDNRESLCRRIREKGMQQRIILEGNRNDVAGEIAASRIFVLSSDVEGMPNALLEAMSLGLACISTDCPCGGPRSVIRNGENGLLVPVGDAKALADALRRILDNPVLEEKLGRNAAMLQQLAPEKVNRMWTDYILRCTRTDKKSRQ